MPQREVSLQKLVAYCEKILRTSEFTDYPGAVNGLQVENSGTVTKIAATVDASAATIQKAVEAGADLLIVHHGLFWGPSHPWTGKRYAMLKLLLENNLAIYSSHLPLDAHPELGNNAQLAAALGLKNAKPFFFDKNQSIGLQFNTSMTRDDLRSRLEKVLGSAVKVIPGGPEKIRKVGIVTGGAGDELKKAHAEGVDSFITGEGRHWTYVLAEELGLNVFYGGHYATETFGVKALAEHLSRKFGVPWVFIDYPTGL
ncbi:MAG TPA: Nif3-like dinuclear metal center hexameric protein [Verrucomicrobiae bacterium]